jgi:transcriptional regulator with XRE-family HTH domain
MFHSCSFIELFLGCQRHLSVNFKEFILAERFDKGLQMLTNKNFFSAALKHECDHKSRGTQAKLARAMGITPKYINDLKAGRKDAGHRLQVKIAQFFDKDLSTFLKIGENILREDIEQQEYGVYKERFTLDQHRKTGKILQAVAEYMQALTVQASISYPEHKIVNQSQKAYDYILELRSSLDSIVYDEAEGLNHNDKCEIYYGKSEFSLEQAFYGKQKISTHPEWIRRMDSLLVEIEKDPELKEFIEQSISMLAERVRLNKKTKHKKT